MAVASHFPLDALPPPLEGRADLELVTAGDHRSDYGDRATFHRSRWWWPPFMKLEPVMGDGPRPAAGGPATSVAT